MVIFSVIRSGNSASDLLRYLFRETATTELLNVWCLISVNDEVTLPKIDGKYSRNIEISSQVNIDVDVDHKFSTEIDYRLDKYWKNARISPIHSNHIRLEQPLRADEAWSIILDVGLTEEPYYPIYRGRHDWVPNTNTLVERHGSHLAARISAKITNSFVGSSSDLFNYVYLYPNEVRATVLVQDIAALTVRNSLGVSRDLINLAAAAGSRSELEELTDKNGLDAEWKNLSTYLDQLTFEKSTAGLKDISFILIDEFTSTGATLENLKKIAIFLDWNVRAVITPFSMSRLGDIAHGIDHCLYSFEN